MAMATNSWEEPDDLEQAAEPAAPGPQDDDTEELWVPFQLDWVEYGDDVVLMVDIRRNRFAPHTPRTRSPARRYCSASDSGSSTSSSSDTEEDEEGDSDTEGTDEGSSDGTSGDTDDDDAGGSGGCDTGWTGGSSENTKCGGNEASDGVPGSNDSLPPGADNAAGTEGDAALFEYLKAQGIMDQILMAGGKQKITIEPLVDGQAPYSVLDLLDQPTATYHLNPDQEPEQRDQLEQVLQRFKSIFSFSKKDIRTTTFGHHDIQLNPDAKRRACKPYRHSPQPAERKIIEEEVAKMLELGLIEPSTSEWASPIVLVRKKDSSTRVCLYYRYQNSQTVPDTFQLPNIEDILASLHGMRYFT